MYDRFSEDALVQKLTRSVMEEGYGGDTSDDFWLNGSHIPPYHG